MERTVTIGAPSLSWEDAHALLESAFKSCTYPLAVTVRNCMPAPACFPEVDGFSLDHVAAGTGVEKQVTVRDYATLQRLGSNIEQICELGRYQAGIRLTAEVPDSAEESASAEEAGPAVQEGKTDAVAPATKRTAKNRKEAK